MPVLGVVQRVPCQPGSQPQVVAEGRPHLVGVMDPWVSHVEQERVQVGPKEFGGHMTGMMAAVKPVGGVEQE